MSIFDRAREGRLATFRSRGITFVPDIDSIIEGLEIGDRVNFVPQPDNEHDPLAVSLVVSSKGEKHHVGFIPQEKTIGYHYAREMGDIFHGEVHDFMITQRSQHDNSVQYNPSITIKIVYDGNVHNDNPLDYVATVLDKEGVGYEGVDKEDILDFAESVYLNIGSPDDVSDDSDIFSAGELCNAAVYFLGNEVDLAELCDCIEGDYFEESSAQEAIDALIDREVIPTSCRIVVRNNVIDVTPVSGADSFWDVEGDPHQFLEGVVMDYILNQVKEQYGCRKIRYV